MCSLDISNKNTQIQLEYDFPSDKHKKTASGHNRLAPLPPEDYFPAEQFSNTSVYKKHF